MSEPEIGHEVVHNPYRHGTARRTTFGYITEDHPRLDAVQNGISAACAAVAGTAVALIAVLTIVEVFTRGLFDRPLGWNVGFVEQYLMVATAFFGTVTAYRSGAHIAVASIFEVLPPRMQKLLMLLVHAVVLTGFVLLVVFGTEAVRFSLGIGEAPPPGMAELPWPTWWWKGIVPTAATAGAVLVVIDIYRELTGSWTATVTNYEPGDHLEGH